MSTMRDGGELARSLERQVEGEVLFDLFSRGRYATDASVYQVLPLGVVVPKTWADVEATLGIAREAGVPVLARGGGTSQCGQTLNRAVVLDLSKHLNRVIPVDREAGRCVVEPGLVPDRPTRSEARTVGKEGVRTCSYR